MKHRLIPTKAFFKEFPEYKRTILYQIGWGSDGTGIKNFVVRTNKGQFHPEWFKNPKVKK